jgi:hypothetical protein
MTDQNNRPEQTEEWGSTSEPSGGSSGGGSSWERDAGVRDQASSGAQGGWTGGAEGSKSGAGSGSGAASGSGAGSGSTGGWGAASDSGEAGGGGSAGTGGAPSGPQQFLSQLQAMIDNIATQSVPVIREVGAKAAELAAVAAERAGPIAQRAAEKTQEVGTRVAERSRTFAEDLRHPEGRTDGGADNSGGSGDDRSSDEPDTTAPSGPTV